VSPLRTSIAGGAARAAGALSRLAGRGGTSLPGKVLLRADPRAIERLGGRLEHGSAVISATNGKTTTAALAAGILERHGERLVHNRAGANMAGGVAAALLHGDGDLGLFEVDEFWLDQVVTALRPRATLLGNLFRDQLDRYGELETIADRWASVAQAGGAGRLVLNADDPSVADLGRDPADAVLYGIEDDAVALAAMQHASDATHCRRCGAPYVYEVHHLGHLGRYRCARCGARRPEPHVRATAIALHGFEGSTFTLGLPGGEATVAFPLPGLYNLYNALGAAALTHALGVPLGTIVAGLEEGRAAFGRGERVRVGDAETLILLVKNPAGANGVLQTLAREHGDLHLLAVLNDQIADGRDVSWIWDADFDLLDGRVARVTCSGTRAPEMALRLKYAGIPAERIAVEPDLPHALDVAVAGAAGQRLYALPTYTAMLALREVLVARGVAQESFA
jgi:UDP-N-acetylmuramyl tripeptide synthase